MEDDNEFDMRDGDSGIGLLEAGDDVDDTPTQLCNTGRELYSTYSADTRNWMRTVGRRDFFSVVREDIDLYAALSRRRENVAFILKFTSVFFMAASLVFTFVAAVTAHASPAVTTVLVFAVLFNCLVILTTCVTLIPEPYLTAVLLFPPCSNAEEYARARQSVARANDFVESMLNHCVNERCSECAKHTAVLHVFKSLRNYDTASFYLHSLD